MASTMACVGLGVASEQELATLLSPDIVVDHIGTIGGYRVGRWQDESGARLVLHMDADGDVVGILPSFATGQNASLATVVTLHDEIVAADLVDGAGETLTRMAVDLEQWRFLPGETTVEGPASVVALGVAMTVYEDAEAFAASQESLMSPDDGSPPPAHFVERGWSWPLRMAPESFISNGIFREPAEADADARMAGIVLNAQRRTTAATGQEFIAASVRSAGFEATVCLPGSDHPGVVRPGNVVAGTAYMTASMPSLEPDS